MRTAFVILLAAVFLWPMTAVADTYCNGGTSESTLQAGCLNGGNVVLIDDFERSDGWGATYCDPANPSNYGWDFTPYPPDGTSPGCGDLLHGTPVNGLVCGGAGVRGTNCAAASGPMIALQGSEGTFMADHALRVSTDELYVRYYIKKLAGFCEGNEKTLTFNATVGSGGIRFAELGRGAAGPPCVSLTASPSGAADVLYNAYTVANLDNNVSSWGWAAGVWMYLEIHLKLNTPGSSDGVYELWVDYCGADGMLCGGTPTLRARYTNQQFRGPGDSTKLGAIWIENWSYYSSVGEEYYDQFAVSTSGPIGFFKGGAATNNAPAAPIKLRIL